MSPVEEYRRTDTGTDRVTTDNSSPLVGFMIFLAVVLAAGAIIFFMTYSSKVTQPPQQQIIPVPVPGPQGPAGPPGSAGPSGESAPPMPKLEAPAVPGTNKGGQPGGASFPYDSSRKTLVV